MVPANTDQSTTARRLVWALPVAFLGTVVVSGLAIALALGGVDLGCLGGGGRANATGPAPTRSAVAEIPRDRLRLYRLAGRRFDIDWTFLASIGAQECDHGSCAGDNGYGCAGPMQISMRRGSPCSPGAGPTLWGTYGVDGNGDGQKDVNDPADAIPAAARILRQSKGAPPVGGTYAEYRHAACNYYGACGDAVAAYADTVMARAIRYGFRAPDSPPRDTGSAAVDQPRRVAYDPATDCGGAGGQVVARGSLGPVKRLFAPRRLAPLPAQVVAPGFGPISCDVRIVENVVYLARRFRQWVTACAAIHSLAGEHPLGAAIDTVPADGNWDHTKRLARASGWRESCAASGVAPACARPPFRAVLYNGFPGHGDPAHCPPPGCPAHLHLSWMTSASQGQPESAARTSLFSPSWVEVITITDTAGGSRRRGGRRA